VAKLPQDRATETLPARHDWTVAELQAANPAEVPWRNDRHAAQLQAATDHVPGWHDR
jgi:hypothetical protein